MFKSDTKVDAVLPVKLINPSQSSTYRGPGNALDGNKDTEATVNYHPTESNWMADFEGGEKKISKVLMQSDTWNDMKYAVIEINGQQCGPSLKTVSSSLLTEFKCGDKPLVGSTIKVAMYN